MDPEPSFFSSFLYIFVSFILVFLNAFFVAAEFAIVKVRRTRLEELVGKGISAAKVSILCVDHLDNYLSATQLGITLVSLALGWIGEESFYNLFLLMAPDQISSQSGTYHAIAAVLSFSIITILHVVVGELVPKSMAIQQAEKITLLISSPLHFFYKMSKPFILTFTSMANFLLKLMGYHGLEEPPFTEEELKLVMRESHEDGVISESEAQIINKAFEFSDKRAREIMTPLDQVDFLSMKRNFRENLKMTQKNMHSRFPLVEDSIESIIGIVHVKDILPLIENNQSNDIFKKIARPVIYVTNSIRQDKIMKILKEKHEHLAIVQDQNSKDNIGIVTLEDILEELVGEILDEHGN